MAKVNVVDKKVQMGLDEIIRFQLITYCSINNITLSELDLDCLVHLGKLGEAELTEFCTIMADKRLSDKLKDWESTPDNPRPPKASPQTIRNVLIKIDKGNLLLKEGNGRKKISLNPDLKIQTEGNILLNYKFIHIGS